jgi:hypothetical protein
LSEHLPLLLSLWSAGCRCSWDVAGEADRDEQLHYRAPAHAGANLPTDRRLKFVASRLFPPRIDRATIEVCPRVRNKSMASEPVSAVSTFGKVIKWVLIGAGVLTGVVVSAVLIGLVLVFTGAPGACGDQEIPFSPAAADRTDAKWGEFKLRAALGLATQSFTEQEITSRGVLYLDEKDVPLDNLQIFLCPQGYAEATGTIRGRGPDIDVRIRGTLDLSGPRPAVDVMSVRAGNLPGLIATQLVDTILDRSDVRTLDIGVNLTSIDITDGEVAIQGRR